MNGIYSLSIVLFLFLQTEAQTKVGFIMSLKNATATLKHRDGKTENLTEKDFYRVLTIDHKLKVGKNGQMQIWLCDNSRPLVPPGKWFSVPSNIICSKRSGPSKRELLENVFSIGARHMTPQRGDNDFILFPTESMELTDTLRPKTAILRWAAFNGKLRLKITVIGDDTLHWEQDDVPGAENFYTSDSLRLFLEKVRERNQDAKLKLTINAVFDNQQAENNAIFTIFPKNRETSLQEELAGVKEDNSLLLHLFRADIFASYGLRIETADEFEEALKLAPESVELLNATATAEEQAGNLTRSRELMNRLRFEHK
ncbi:MAG TPA: hypothetical protein VGO50_06180 [Pyrinomonadaceae bacterium]|jgi:hypothetical protein|nr:hypothetical protein [Pyrinomonadaceae bacterium]